MSSKNNFRRILGVITAAALTLSILPFGSLAHNAYAAEKEEPFVFSLSGAGTAVSPYLIDNLQDLENMRDAINDHDTDSEYASAYYKLTADIEFTGYGQGQKSWYPVGRNQSGLYLSTTQTKQKAFYGVFDGDGHKISGIYIDNKAFGANRAYTVGLFGKNDGIIKNLEVEGTVKVASGMNVGLLCGSNDGIIENCSVHGNITAAFAVGGISGYTYGTIRNCFSDVVSSSSYGFITGVLMQSDSSSANAAVENCYFNKDKGSGKGILQSFEEQTTVYGLSAKELKTGSAAWALQNAQENKSSVIWGQDLNSDDIPMLKSEDRVYKVTYMLGSIVVSEEYCNADSTLNPPSVDFADNGYSSGDKWFKDEALSDEWLFGSDIVTEDTLLYSQRAPIQYTITLNLNGGVLEETDEWTQSDDDTYTRKYTVVSEDITLPHPTMEGFDFIGWTSDHEDDSTGEAVKDITISQGSTENRVYNAIFADATAPSISITMGEHEWVALHEAPAFDIYYNTPQTVKVSAVDNINGSDLTIYYYISEKGMSKSALESSSVSWTPYTEEGITLKPQKKAIVYVKATDKSGNSAYAGTTGIVLETVPPVISGVVNNAEYCADAEFTVKDENLSTITVNGDILYDSKAHSDPGIEEGPSAASISQLQSSYKLESISGGEEQFVIVAEDKAGNSTTCTITISGRHVKHFSSEEIIHYPTCTETGFSIIYTRCKICHEIYNTEERVTPARGHSWPVDWDIVSSPDCDDSGVRTRTCKVCKTVETENINPEGHDWDEEYTIDKVATCTEEGSKSRHCRKCDAVTDSEVIPSLDHNVDEANPTVVVISPVTCTSDGQTDYIYYCYDCGSEVFRKTETIISQGHQYGDWEELSSGVLQRECSVCGHPDTRDATESDHKWNTEYTIDKYPTCTTDGSRSIRCSVCNTAKMSENIPATGHDPEEPVKENEVLSTCTTDGSYEEAVYCKNCNEEIVRTHHTVVAEGHTWGEWEIIESPDCDDEGTQKHTCQVCGVSETRGLEASGHVWNEDYTIDKEADCTTEGSRSIHCSKCGAIKESEVIPALGHDWSEWETIVSPDCDDDGTQQRTCKVCGFVETRGLIASGHTWEEEYTIDKEATCTEEGSRSIHCKNCDAVRDSEVIPAKGHTPVLDELGNTVCEVCGKLLSTVFISKSEGNAPKAELSDEEIRNIEDTVLTEDDKTALQNGGDVSITLTISDAENTVSDYDKNAVEEKIKGTYELGSYFDIDLVKTVNNIETQITELNKEIVITVAVPDELKKADRTFAVVRVHNGKSAVLSDEDSNDDTVTFSTDKFSVYAIVYIDDQQTGPFVPAPSVPGTSSGGTTGTTSDEPTAPDESTSPDETASPSETVVPDETTQPDVSENTDSTESSESTVSPDNSDSSADVPPATGIALSFASVIAVAAASAAAMITHKNRKN